MKTRFIALLAAASLVACEKDLDKVNPNSPTPNGYYQTGPQLLEGVNAIYAALQGSDLFSREYFFLHDLRSGETSSGGGQLEIARQQILNGAQATDNSVNLSVWRGLYRLIHRANVVIVKAPGAQTNLTDALRDRYVAEARFFRGWAYYELVTLYGRVPIYTKYANYDEGLTYEPRAQSELVYAQAINDLTEAANNLPETYATADLGRVTKWAALAMLGRVYAQQGDLAKAKEALEPVRKSNRFSLADRYEDNLNEEGEFNKESIFEVYFSEALGPNFVFSAAGSPTGTQALTENTIRGQEYSPIAWRNLVPSTSLLSEYESKGNGDEKADPRYAYNFYEVGDKYNNGVDILKNTQVQGAVNHQNRKVSWKKYTMIYKRASEQNSSGINIRVLRYAEVLLLLAEIENEQGNLAKALEYLNQVRTRKTVEMPPYPTKRFPCTNKDEVFRAVAHEKMVELAGEQIRNRDLLRWRRAGKVGTGKLLSEPISYFQANKYELLPIPQSEVDNNDQIGPEDQNPGY